ncbi:MAG: rod shape-determining protein RodA [Roseburia sp.]|nr:rod shape-determining protein RodA [Roseburia sp.]MCM1098075.1 rod shape-determining protein RodA [Ruminococcus flavefaciens]
MFTRFKIRDYDFKLTFMTVALAAIGVVVIGSAEPSLQTRQLAGAVVGAALMIIISFFNYTWIIRLNWVLYAVNLGLLLAVKYLGSEGGGAQRWLEVGGLRFQPSETAKILLILFFAQFIMKYRSKINTVRMIGASVVLIAIPFYLIYKQPDLSTSVVVIVLFCVLMFAGGISWKIVIGAMAVAIPAVALLVSLALDPDTNLEIFRGFQVERILGYLYPDEYANTTAYQQLNSVTAIASGQLDGKGYCNNEITSVKNGNFISEAETDFIFAVLGEEFGFKGSLAVILLLFGISLECISVARKAKDLAGTIIAAGMGGLVAFQGFCNVGVATFLLPNTGLPLPFVSYGLTSLMSLFMGMGFVLNVRLQAKKAK